MAADSIQDWNLMIFIVQFLYSTIVPGMLLFTGNISRTNSALELPLTVLFLTIYNLGLFLIARKFLKTLSGADQLFAWIQWGCCYAYPLVLVFARFLFQRSTDLQDIFRFPNILILAVSLLCEIPVFLLSFRSVRNLLRKLTHNF